jgi:transcriptional regulator of acetoin/glycerol metabolism
MCPEQLASAASQHRIARALDAVRRGVGTLHESVRDAVLASWLRSRQHGIVPALAQAPVVLDDDALRLARDDAEWLGAAHRAVAERSAGFDYDGHIVALFDARGRFLAGDGDRHALDGLADINFRPGALWTEAAVGTNGPGTALATGEAVHIVGTEHFCEAWQPWHCAAVPIRDPADGTLVGVLDLSGAARKASGHVVQLAHVLAIAVEQALGGMDARRRVRLLEQLTDMAGRYPHDPVVVLDRRGRVVGATRQVPRALQRDGTRHATLLDTLTRLGHAPVERSVRLPLADDVEIEALARPVLEDGRCIGSTLQLLAVADRGATTTTFDVASVPVAAHASPDRSHVVSPDAPSTLPPSLAPRDVGRMTPTARRTTAPTAGPMASLTQPSVAQASHPHDAPRALRDSGEHARPARAGATPRTTRFTFDDIVGTSPALREAVRIARAAARNALPVLLLGESGTGKEVVAQAIHAGSARASRPFVAVNCAAIPRELLEAELFGYVGGAFSGARREGAAGKFEAARGGTIFLDEIGELTPAAQAALLRVLQEGEITRVGANATTRLDVRVIAATNRDPAQAMHAGLLREDLFYRLNVLAIELPPLRARHDDLHALVPTFLDDACRELDAPVMTLSREAMLVLERWPWPGNVRELKNLVRRLVALATTPLIDTHDLPAAMREAPVVPPASPGTARVATPAPPPRARPGTWRAAPAVDADALTATVTGEHARDSLLAAIAASPTMRDAARLLGITRSTLYRRLEALGLRPGRGVR